MVAHSSQAAQPKLCIYFTPVPAFGQTKRRLRKQLVAAPQHRPVGLSLSHVEWLQVYLVRREEVDEGADVCPQLVEHEELHPLAAEETLLSALPAPDDLRQSSRQVAKLLHHVLKLHAHQHRAGCLVMQVAGEEEAAGAEEVVYLPHELDEGSVGFKDKVDALLGVHTAIYQPRPVNSS